MFYSALQEGELIATGLNSTSLEECVDEVIDFISVDSDEIIPMGLSEKLSRLRGLGYDVDPHPYLKDELI